jgi:hypothetical protein
MMPSTTDLINRLRRPKDGRDTTELELEAAGQLESLQFQLAARIGVARAEAKEELKP